MSDMYFNNQFFRFTTVTRDIRANRTDKSLSQNIALEKEPADLVVTIVDHNNKTLEGTQVQLLCGDPQEEIPHVLREDGNYFFDHSLPTLRPGDCTLKVTKKG